MKKVMSISELVSEGYSRDALKAYVREDDFPGYKTPGGGKWMVYTDRLPGWIEKYNRRKALIRPTVRRRRRAGS